MGRNDSLRRRRPLREPKRRLLIVTEGEVTEPEYFKALRHHCKALVDIHFAAVGVPKTCVERAINLRAIDEQKFKDPNLQFDESWCVFDVDNHPKLAEAAQQAKDNGIRLAISNPNFELWLLIHFQEHSSHIQRNKLPKLLKKHMPDYEKSPDMAILLPLHEDATRHAEKLRNTHKRNGKPGANPSTDVHDLVNSIKRQ